MLKQLEELWKYAQSIASDEDKESEPPEFRETNSRQRFQDISVLPEKECLLTTVDHFIKASKISML